MKSKPVPKDQQCTFLYPNLIDQLDPKDPLLILAKKIPWDHLEKEFAPLYAERGRPAKPVRLMVGLLLLKQLENLSDERVVEEWRRNPYFQAFCGMKSFQWKLPCEPSDFCHFRKRIGVAGIEKIFQVSIAIHGKAAMESEIVIDTTVQEKNISYPTDTKLRIKVISRCWKIAKTEGLKFRRSYKRELKDLLRTIRFNRTRDVKARNRAIRRIKTIANALISDIERKLGSLKLPLYADDLELFKKAVNQKRTAKNKIYSLHEPEVFCIAKGKEHKKYEFGNKASIAQTLTRGIIVGALNTLNEFDGNTLKNVIFQIKRLVGRQPEIAFCDRGYRGTTEIAGVKIEIPKSVPEEKTEHYKRKAKAKFRRRSAIEATNSHLKHDFRMLRNFLKGSEGDTINILMAAAAYNLKMWMRATALQFFALFLLPIFISKIACHGYTVALKRHKTIF